MSTTVLITSKGTQSMEVTVIAQPKASPHGGSTLSSYVILVYLIKQNSKIPWRVEKKNKITIFSIKGQKQVA